MVAPVKISKVSKFFPLYPRKRIWLRISYGSPVGRPGANKKGERRWIASEPTERFKVARSIRKEETNMSELRYPNESKEYREARAALLKDEQELVDKMKSVAEKRRKLPPGGELKEDYVFQWANDGKVGKSVKFSELFADKNTLLLYSFMFGPNWDKPCLSCTSLVDGFDRTWYQVIQAASFVAIAKAPAERINAWAKQRGWSQIWLVSGSESPYQADYKC